MFPAQGRSHGTALLGFDPGSGGLCPCSFSDQTSTKWNSMGRDRSFFDTVLLRHRSRIIPQQIQWVLAFNGPGGNGERTMGITVDSSSGDHW
jgi:hypothetical protein